MRILHVIGTLDPRSGGPAAAVASIARFQAYGTHHEVVTLDDPRASFLEDLGISVTALGPSPLNYGYTARLVPWLRANSDRFDGIIVHGIWQHCGQAVRKLFSGRKPYLVFTHGMLDPYFRRTFPFKHLKKWVYWLLVEYWVLRGACRVLFTSDEEARLATQSFWFHTWRGTIIPLGTIRPESKDNALRTAFLSQFQSLQSRRFLLFLGRIDRKKGCDLLIQAFICAAHLDPALDLVMAGPDESDWKGGLEVSVAAAGLTARVHWTGMLHGDDKWGAFLACEAFILPSHQENFGIAVTEALACGKPVLLSNKVNIAAQIADAGAGLIDSDSVEGTLRLVTAWIKMPDEERLGMANAAQRMFDSQYDMRNHAYEIDNFLREVITGQNRALASSGSLAN